MAHCTQCQCGTRIAQPRAQLGYQHCMECGEKQAIQARRAWCVAPINKSNYVLITDLRELAQLNPKRTT